MCERVNTRGCVVSMSDFSCMTPCSRPSKQENSVIWQGGQSQKTLLSCSVDAVGQ